jgi:hypothetical protein
MTPKPDSGNEQTPKQNILDQLNVLLSSDDMLTELLTPIALSSSVLNLLRKDAVTLPVFREFLERARTGVEYFISDGIGFDTLPSDIEFTQNPPVNTGTSFNEQRDAIVITYDFVNSYKTGQLRTGFSFLKPNQAIADQDLVKLSIAQLCHVASIRKMYSELDAQQIIEEINAFSERMVNDPRAGINIVNLST